MGCFDFLAFEQVCVEHGWRFSGSVTTLTFGLTFALSNVLDLEFLGKNCGDWRFSGMGHGLTNFSELRRGSKMVTFEKLWGEHVCTILSKLGFGGKNIDWDSSVSLGLGLVDNCIDRCGCFWRQYWEWFTFSFVLGGGWL